MLGGRGPGGGQPGMTLENIFFHNVAAEVTGVLVTGVASPPASQPDVVTHVVPEGRKGSRRLRVCLAWQRRVLWLIWVLLLAGGWCCSGYRNGTCTTGASSTASATC
jgi:hypothetical protein